MNLNKIKIINKINMKKEKICIIGGSGSGKNFLLNGLIAKGERYQPKLTTRPIRQGELNGIDYHYIDNPTFSLLHDNDHIKTYQKFDINNQIWFYAITKENFINNNLFIMTPHELSFLSEKERKGCFVVYLDINEEIRRKRISGRNDNNDSIDRRLLADRIDFIEFKDYDMKVSDPDFDINLIYDFAF